MNEFDRAKLKSQQREERKTITLPKKVEVPKEKEFKPSPRDAVIRVSVDCPSGAHHFLFVRPNVAANISPSRMTRNELKKMFLQGMAPLLGAVNELPVSSEPPSGG